MFLIRGATPKRFQLLEYGNTFRRIDLYNAEKNRLISLGVANASEIRAQLIKNGISDKAAENLLRDIYPKMPENYKEIFNYSAEKTDVVYADIPNIGEYLAQSQLSQQVIGKAVCYGEIPQDNGSKCCIYDKNSGKFDIMPVLPRLDVMARLSQMGYSEMSAKEIADKIIGSYRDTDKEKTEEVKQESVEVAPKTFDSNNSELKNFMYHNTGDGNVFMMNTKEEGAGTGDQFWTDATRLLLSALCFLLIEVGEEEEQNFAAVLDLIHKANHACIFIVTMEFSTTLRCRTVKNFLTKIFTQFRMKLQCSLLTAMLILAFSKAKRISY